MADNGIDTSILRELHLFDLPLSHFLLLLFGEVSLDQSLAAAVDAAQKAGEVYLSFFYLSLPLSLIDPVGGHIIKSGSFWFYIVQVIRKGFYETKHVEHKGQVLVQTKTSGHVHMDTLNLLFWYIGGSGDGD